MMMVQLGQPLALGSRAHGMLLGDRDRSYPYYNYIEQSEVLGSCVRQDQRGLQELAVVFIVFIRIVCTHNTVSNSRRPPCPPSWGVAAVRADCRDRAGGSGRV